MPLGLGPLIEGGSTLSLSGEGLKFYLWHGQVFNPNGVNGRGHRTKPPNISRAVTVTDSFGKRGIELTTNQSIPSEKF